MLCQVRGEMGGVKNKDEVSRRGFCAVPGVKREVGVWKEYQECSY